MRREGSQSSAELVYAEQRRIEEDLARENKNKYGNNSIYFVGVFLSVGSNHRYCGIKMCKIKIENADNTIKNTELVLSCGTSDE